MDTKAIREALEQATPGPWSHNDMDTAFSHEVYVNPTGWEYIEIAGGMKKDDAHLIANAPEWIRQLLDENERLRDKFVQVEDVLVGCKTMLDRALADKAAALDVLQEISEHGGTNMLGATCAECARAALERLDVGEK